jgi:biotin carboxylase
VAVIILLGGGVENLPIIARARALGHTTVVVDGSAAAPGFALADVPVLASCYDAAATLWALASVADLRPAGVLCAGVDAPHVAAAVAAAYGLPGLKPAAAALSVDKYNQKEALRDAGLPVPDFWTITKWGEQRMVSGHHQNKDISGWDHYNTRSIVKPVDSRGARGVTLLSEKPDKVQIAQAIQLAEAQSPTHRAIVEEYLPGPQLSTESIVAGGRVLFTAVALRNYDRLAEFAPHIIENGCDAPVEWDQHVGLGDEVWRLPDAIDEAVLRACRALGWDNLTVKGDLIIHDDRLVILELAARLSGGFLSTHTIPLAYGVPFVDHAIGLALGQPADVSHSGTPVRYVCQRYLFAAPADIGKRVVSVPEMPLTAHKIMQIEFATYAVRPGDVLRPVTDHGARLGQAIATGATPAQAQARAEAAVAAMRDALVLA